MGGKRAISIIQVMMDAKTEARSTNVNTIRRYFTPKKVQGKVLFFFQIFFLFSSFIVRSESWN